MEAGCFTLMGNLNLRAKESGSTAQLFLPKVVFKFEIQILNYAHQTIDILNSAQRRK